MARSLERSGVAVRAVSRHGSTSAAGIAERLWRTASIRPGQILAIDGCVRCRLPHAVVRLGPAEAERVLVAVHAARARGDVPAMPDEPTWTVEVRETRPEQEWMHDSWLAMVDGIIGTQGSPLTTYPPARREVMVAGVYSGIGPATDALRAPDWTRLSGHLRAERPLRRVLDLRTGLVHHEGTSTVGSFRAVTFASRSLPGVGVLRAQGGGARAPVSGPLAPGHGETTHPRRPSDPVVTVIDGEPGGVAVAAREKSTGAGSDRRLDRIAAYRAGSHRRPPRRDAVRLLRSAERQGVAGLIEAQRETWARRWAEMGISLSGDEALQRAIRFSLFHLDASIANQAEAPLGPRGLTGPSYKAHVFWDSECYVLPFFAATRPRAARAMLTYRVRRLAAAQAAAREAGYAGAWFPWESAADGRDVTPMWVHGDDAMPIRVWTGERELHVVADIAWAVDHYVAWSGDEAFARTDGLRILVETARFWASRLERDPDGSAHLRGVIGPDEYHELVDDNAFTNVMARWNLRAAATAVRRARTGPRAVPPSRLALPDAEELEEWESLADAIVDGYDPRTGIYEQFAGFHDLEPVRIADLASRPVPADVLLGRERVAAAQVVKQADVVLLHHLVPDAVEPGSLAPNLDHYEPLTAHGSSLSPGAYATLLARAGRTQAALETLAMTAYMDLDDRSGKAAEGLHIPTMGALWQALVMGFGGIRPQGDALTIDPRLPPAWPRLETALRFRGRRVSIEMEAERIVVRSSPGLTIAVRGAGRIVMRGRTAELLPAEDGWAFADRRSAPSAARRSA